MGAYYCVGRASAGGFANLNAGKKERGAADEVQCRARFHQFFLGDALFGIEFLPDIGAFRARGSLVGLLIDRRNLLRVK